MKSDLKLYVCDIIELKGMVNMRNENGKGKANGRNYFKQYPLNLYNTEKEIRLWEEFSEAFENNFSNCRTALLQSMQLYIDKYGEKEE